MRGYKLMVKDVMGEDPTTVEESLIPQRQKWKAAMQAEFDSLLRNGTWILVDRPKCNLSTPA